MVAAADRVLPVGAQSSLDGRGDAPRRTRAEHAGAELSRSARATNRSRRRGCAARHAPADTDRLRSLLPSGPDFRWRLHRRHHCHQRRGRGDVQVRIDTRLGFGDHRCARQRRGPRHPSRTVSASADGWFELESVAGHSHPCARAHLPHAGSDETVGGLFRAPPHGPDRSLHRLRRHTRHHRRSRAAAGPAPAPAGRARPLRRRRPGDCAHWNPPRRRGRSEAERIRSTSRPSSTWMRGRSAPYRTRPLRARRCRGRQRG